MFPMHITDVSHSVGHSGEVFLACDNEPVTKEEICQSALMSGLYRGCPAPQVR
jgi:hypothetical protein